MKFEDMEKKLRDAKFRHLTEDELDFFYDQKLDSTSQIRAAAHLEMCLICTQRLGRIEEERAVWEEQEVTPEDVMLVRRVLQQLEQQPLPDPHPTKTQTAPSIKQRLNDSLRQIAESLRAHFLQLKEVRGAPDGPSIFWQGQSRDGLIKAYATEGRNGSLTIHFSSDDLRLQGERFTVGFGARMQEITFHLASDTSGVYAEIAIAQNQLPINLDVIDIKPIS